MSDIGKNYLYNVLTQIISFVVPLILVPYTSRTLGVDNIGIYSYMQSIVTIFSSVGRLGLNTYGQLQVSQNRDNKERLTQITWELIKLRILSSVIMIVLYVIFICSFHENTCAGLIFTFYLLADCLDIVWFFQGLEMYKYIALRTLSIRALNLILILLFIHGKNDLYRYILIMEFTLILTNLFLWTNLKKHIDYVNIFKVKGCKHIRNCLVYLIPTIANLIYNILDKTMLGYIGGSTYESGCYEQAYKIINIAQSVVLTIAATTVSRLTFYYKSNDKVEYNNLLSRSVKMMYILAFPISIGVFVNSELIVNVVLGPDYAASVRILQYLSVLLVFATFNYNIGYQVLVATENQKEYNIGVIIGGIMNFTLNIILISRFAATGATIASLAAEIIISVFFILFASRHIRTRIFFPAQLLQYLFSAILMGAGCQCLQYFFQFIHNNNQLLQLLIIIMISVILYFGILFIEGVNPIKILSNKT